MKIGHNTMLRKFTAVAAPVVTAVAIAGAGIAQAEPGTPDIGYEARLVGNTVVTTLTDGEFEYAGNTVNIKDTAGNTVVALPLSFVADGLVHPLPSTISDDARTLSLTAVKDAAATRPAAVQEIASPIENQKAMANFSSQFGIATAVGAFIGTAVGALIGALISSPTGPGIVAGLITGAAVGSIIGSLAVGGPTLFVAGIELISTLAAAPGTTKWASVSEY
ncbi:ammonium transporter [Nocardia sp. NPDC005978]|uniref:ammonium transporter n=1 Tax=Nocardia sp. NPDC005978 TaxID=3156725 RepID=UPI0033B17664